jgi:hypothetical protein
MRLPWGKASGKRVYLQLKSGNSYLSPRQRDDAEVFTINPSCYLLEIHELLRSNEGKDRIALGEEEAHGRQN